MPHFQREGSFFLYIFYYNMTISTQYSIKHRNNVQKYVKIPSEVCTRTHNSTLKNKKAPHRGEGDTPSHTLSPLGWLRSLAGGFQEIWNTPCGISVYIMCGLVIKTTHSPRVLVLLYAAMSSFMSPFRKNNYNKIFFFDWLVVKYLF